LEGVVANQSWYLLFSPVLWSPHVVLQRPILHPRRKQGGKLAVRKCGIVKAHEYENVGMAELSPHKCLAAESL
jgi:hypothetical protein